MVSPDELVFWPASQRPSNAQPAWWSVRKAVLTQLPESPAPCENTASQPGCDVGHSVNRCPAASLLDLLPHLRGQVLHTSGLASTLHAATRAANIIETNRPGIIVLVAKVPVLQTTQPTEQQQTSRRAQKWQGGVCRARCSIGQPHGGTRELDGGCVIRFLGCHMRAPCAHVSKRTTGAPRNKGILPCGLRASRIRHTACDAVVPIRNMPMQLCFPHGGRRGVD